MLKLLIFLLILFFGFLIQASFLSEFSLRGFPPQILIILLSLLLAFSSKEDRWILVLFSALIAEFFSFFPIGIASLCILALGFLHYLFCKQVLTEINLLALLLLLILSILFYNTSLACANLILKVSNRSYLEFYPYKELLINFFWKSMISIITSGLILSIVFPFRKYLEHFPEFKIET